MLTAVMREILRDKPNLYSPLVQAANIEDHRDVVSGGRWGLSAGSLAAGNKSPEGQGPVWRSPGTAYVTLSVGSFATLNIPKEAVSIECWARNTSGSVSGQDALLNKPFTSHNPPYYQYGLMANNSPGLILVGSMGGSFRSITSGAFPAGTTWVAGKWLHVAATWCNYGDDAGFVHFYVNGRRFATNTADAGTGNLGTYNTGVSLWRLFNHASAYWGGELAHMAVFPYRISDGQVLRHYRAARYGMPNARRSPSGLYLPRAA